MKIHKPTPRPTTSKIGPREQAALAAQLAQRQGQANAAARQRPR